MYTASIIALSGLLSLVAAVPAGKRDIVWVTETQEDVVTVDVTTTIWVVPTDSPSSDKNSYYPSTTSTFSAQSTYNVSAAPSSAMESAPVASSTYEAPTTSAYVAPTITSAIEAVRSTPSTTSTSDAPSTTEAPASTSSATSTTNTQAASGTSPSGSTYTGDITYYAPGLGSCGQTSTDSDPIVALSHDIMVPEDGDNPNTNPLCGKTITISYGGVTKTATIVDTCEGCDESSIDLSPSLFSDFAPESEGRVSGVVWSIDS